MRKSIFHIRIQIILLYCLIIILGITPIRQALAQTPEIQLRGLSHVSAVYDIEVAGDYAFALERGTLRVLSIREPFQMQEVASLKFDPPRARIARLGSRLYLTGFHQPLGVIDIAKPTAPKWIGEWSEFVVWNDGFEIDGEHGYIVTQAESGELTLKILDLTIGSDSPSVLGQINIGKAIVSGISSSSNMGGLHISGGKAFIVVAASASGQHGFLIEVNVENPSAPTVNQIYPLPDNERFLDVHVSDSLVYLLRNDEVVGLTVFKLRVGPNLERLGEASHPDIYAPMDLVCIGSVVYATVKGGIHLVAFDVSDPRLPRVSFEHTTPDIWAAGLGMTIVDDRLYVAGDAGPSPVFDISEPANPHLLGYWMFEGGYAGAIAHTEKLVLVGNVLGGYFVIDASDPSEPKRLARMTPHLDPKNYKWDMIVTLAACETKAIVAYERNGVEVVDLKDPADPIVLARFNPSGLVLSAVMTPTHAYLGSRNAAAGQTPYFFDESSFTYGGSVEVVDLQDPLRPRSLVTVDVGGPVTDLDLLGSLLLAVQADGSLTVFDVTDPESPQIVGEWEGEGVVDAYPTRTGRIALFNDLPRVALTHRTASWNTVLSILDLSDIARPRLIGRQKFPKQTIPGTLVGVYEHFVVVYNGHQFSLVDAQDPSNLRIELFQPLPVTEPYYEDAFVDLSVNGSFIYLTMHERGLWIFELSQKP